MVNSSSEKIGIRRTDKKCSRCQVTKPVSAFHQNRARYDGLHTECRLCVKAYLGKYYKKNLEKYRGMNLARYGITVVEYERLLRKQDGACAICRRECMSGKRLSVDHCHRTGKVRGLLCSKCNTGLGLFDDMIAVLRKAIVYLQSSTHGKEITHEQKAN